MDYAKGIAIKPIEDVEDSVGFDGRAASFFQSLGDGIRWMFILALLPAVVIPIAIEKSDRFASVWGEIEVYTVEWAAIGGFVIVVSVVIGSLTPRGRAALRYIVGHAMCRRSASDGAGGTRIE